VAGVIAFEALIGLLSAALPAQHRLQYALLAGNPPVTLGCLIAMRAASGHARSWLIAASLAFVVVTVLVFGDFTNGYRTGSQLFSSPLASHVVDVANLVGFSALAYAATHLSRARSLSTLGIVTLAVIGVVAVATLTKSMWGPEPAFALPMLGAAMFGVTAAYLFEALRSLRPA
jgi:hypothetical protein